MEYTMPYSLFCYRSTPDVDPLGDTMLEKSGVITWVICWWFAHGAIAGLFSLRWRYMTSYIYLTNSPQTVCHITHFSAHPTSDLYRCWCVWCNLGVLMENFLCIGRHDDVSRTFDFCVSDYRTSRYGFRWISIPNMSTLIDFTMTSFLSYKHLSN